MNNNYSLKFPVLALFPSYDPFQLYSDIPGAKLHGLV